MRCLLVILCAAAMAATASGAPTAEAPLGNPDAPAELAYFRRACCECPVESTYCELGYPDTPPDRVACVLYTEENKLYKRYQAPVSCCAADGSIDGSQITGTLVSATIPASRVTGTLSSATIPAAQVTGSLENAVVPGANIDNPIAIFHALGLTDATVQVLNDKFGGVLQCPGNTARIGACPAVPNVGGTSCQLDSSDSSSCSYISTALPSGDCPEFKILCA
ncbi:hypothetical protein DFJ74DRAFT_664016 [Hyaloraphidium curvatum]|nr:hypothetical protein DFJ74DRAFT_664016 [Hyaloraphidium curvatum]